MSNIQVIQEKLGYTFSNQNLLETALTHISYAKECGEVSYERLEFLGDAVLELVVSDVIYKTFNIDAGKMSKLRASLVSTNNLCNIAQNLGLNASIKKSKSLPSISKKTTADLFESVVGAVYLDGGFSHARELIERLVIIDTTNLETHLNNCVDAKTMLQELMQSLGRNFEYKLISSTGMDHEKKFEVELFISGVSVSKGLSTSIQSAEEIAAGEYLKTIQ